MDTSQLLKWLEHHKVAPSVTEAKRKVREEAEAGLLGAYIKEFCIEQCEMCYQPAVPSALKDGRCGGCRNPQIKRNML